MKLKNRHLLVLAALGILVFCSACSEDRDPSSLPQGRANIDPVVFDEQYDYRNVLYGEDAYFQPFSGTDTYSLKVDSLYASNGKLSIRITVPPKDSSMGAYAGGVLTTVAARDFADFNAMTFKARTDSISKIVFNELGYGNDNTGTSLFGASRAGIEVTNEWTFFTIPIPNSAKLVAERGIFTFAEGYEEPHVLGYSIWFDEIKFAKINNITETIPLMPSGNQNVFIGATATLDGTRTRYVLDNGTPFFVNHSPSYFDFESSADSVAVVDGNTIRVVGAGTAVITGQLGDVKANGQVVLTGYTPPATPAPAPTLPASDVISMFSDVYTNVPIDTWNTFWSPTQNQDYQVQGNNTIMYTNLSFVGIEFLNPTINATAMTHFHIDVYAPTGANFKVKLACFPPGEAGLETLDYTMDGTTTPTFTPGVWSSLDIPLTDFQLPTGVTWDDWDWSNVGQLILSTYPNMGVVLVDNVYWHK